MRGSVLLNTFAVNLRGYGIKMKSGQRGRMAGRGQTVSGTCLVLLLCQAVLSGSFCFYLNEVHVTMEGQTQPTAIFCLPRNILKIDCEILSMGHSLMVHLLQAP